MSNLRLTLLASLSFLATSHAIADKISFSQFQIDPMTQNNFVVFQQGAEFKVPTEHISWIDLILKLPEARGAITHFAISNVAQMGGGGVYIPSAGIFAGMADHVTGRTFFATPLCNDGNIVSPCGPAIKIGSYGSNILYLDKYQWEYDGTIYELEGTTLTTRSSIVLRGVKRSRSEVTLLRHDRDRGSPGHHEWLKIDLAKDLILEPYLTESIKTVWVHKNPDGKYTASLSPDRTYIPSLASKMREKNGFGKGVYLVGEVASIDSQLDAIQIKVIETGKGLLPGYLGRLARVDTRLTVDLTIDMHDKTVTFQGEVVDRKYAKNKEQIEKQVLRIASVTYAPSFPSGELFQALSGCRDVLTPKRSTHHNVVE